MKKRKTEASVLPGAEAQGTVAAHVCSPTPVSPAHMPGRGGCGAFFAAQMQLGSENVTCAVRKHGLHIPERLPWVWAPPQHAFGF